MTLTLVRVQHHTFIRRMTQLCVPSPRFYYQCISSFPCSLGKLVASNTFRFGVLLFAAFTASSAAHRPISAYDIGIAATRRSGRSSCMSANNLSTGTSVFRRVLILALKVRADVLEGLYAVDVWKDRRFGRDLPSRRLMLDWHSMIKVTSHFLCSPWQCGILFFHAKHCVRRKGTKSTMQSSTWFLVSSQQ